MRLPRLSDEQRALVRIRLPGAALVRDMSWGLVDTAVLHVATPAGGFVVKAGGPGNHHIGREIDAHETVTRPLAERGDAARLVAADRGTNLLITEYLPGELVLGSPLELYEDVHQQAARILAALHAQGSRIDDHIDAAQTTKSLRWLDAPHRIDPGQTERAREILHAHRPRPVRVVPTHGDWHPRNWIVDRGRVRAIDWGRFAWRQPASDFTRLAVQQVRTKPALADAFVAGYGSDPRDDAWLMIQLHEAIGTAVWAHQVGDEPFEAQGIRMLDEALADF